MDSNAVWNLLQTLVGTWEGNGAGRFPTIDDFRYREVLEITGGFDELVLHYKQRTWRLTDDGETESHKETGFIGVKEDGTVEITSAQGNDRVEVLSGGVSVSDEGLFLDLESLAIAHDDRMIRSWRTIVFDTQLLTYTMGMATTAVPEGDAHLAAELTKLGS
jgi:hypothetical protein